MDSIQQTKNNFLSGSETTEATEPNQREKQQASQIISRCERNVSLPIPPSLSKLFDRTLYLFTGPDMPLDHPSDYDYSLMSKTAYASSQQHKNKELSLPNGWTVSSYFENLSNGYFGAAYQNEEMKHIVIAHRGSDLTKAEVWKTDIQGIALNIVTEQQASAHIFTKKIKKQVEMLNRESGGNNYKFSHTGHSLGGWLAGTCAWYSNVSGVTFDSPDFRNMIEKLKESKPKFLDEETLDVITYLAASNIVNTCNDHVGTRYRLFPEDNLQHSTSQTPEKVRDLLESWPTLIKNVVEFLLQQPLNLDILNIHQHFIDGLIASFEFNKEYLFRCSKT